MAGTQWLKLLLSSEEHLIEMLCSAQAIWIEYRHRSQPKPQRDGVRREFMSSTRCMVILSISMSAVMHSTMEFGPIKGPEWALGVRRNVAVYVVDSAAYDVPADIGLNGNLIVGIVPSIKGPLWTIFGLLCFGR